MANANFYCFQIKFGVPKSSKSAIYKKWQIASNLINFRDVSCESVSCSFYWAPMPSSNPVGIGIPITTRRCLAWKMPSSLKFIIDCQKSSFSHVRMLKSDSTLVVLVKAFANPSRTFANAQTVPLDHPIPYWRTSKTGRPWQLGVLNDEVRSTTLWLYRYLVIDGNVIIKNTSNDMSA